MSNNFYKETYRREMIQWSEEIRKKDPGYFCKLACDKGETTCDSYYWYYSLYIFHSIS